MATKHANEIIADYEAAFEAANGNKVPGQLLWKDGQVAQFTTTGHVVGYAESLDVLEVWTATLKRRAAEKQKHIQILGEGEPQKLRKFSIQSMQAAVEYGFRQHEKGHNLEMVIGNFIKMMMDAGALKD